MSIRYLFLMLIVGFSLIFSSMSVHADEDPQEQNYEEPGDEESDEVTINKINESARDPIPASLLKRVKQSFSDTVFEMMNDKSEVFEAGQGLGPEFQNAYEARRRLNHCHKFIREDGNLGDWGLVVESTLVKFNSLRSELLSTEAGLKAGMREVCPMFRQLDEEERIEFWVWVMTSLALFESTCGFDVSNSINSNAVGIYQLHKSTVDRAPRALIANKTCGKISGAEIAKPEMNIACTLDFIRDGFSGRLDHAPAGLVTRAQQFEKLRSSSNGLIRVIKKFKACQFDPKKQS